MSRVGTCAGCGEAIALHLARALIGADGHVDLWCAACLAPKPATIEVAEIAPPRPSVFRRAARYGMPVAGVGVAFAAMLSSAAVTVIEKPAEPAAPAAAAEAAPAAVAVAAAPASPAAAGEDADSDAAAEAEIVPHEPHTAMAEGMVEIDLDELMEERPTLLEWVHPVTGSEELTPARSTRRFGAKRVGVADPSRCGQGHCGVDLAGPRGRPVAAVAFGTVVRVEHSLNGRDGRSGRYVRIEHPEGVFTSYMHLDAITAELKVGDEINAGHIIGTLGKTGIYSGEQHLHFSLEIQESPSLRYIDPAPFLADAEVLPVPVDELRLTPDQRSQW